MPTARRNPAGAMPNFLLIGAAKSGSSALWNFLDQHPSICMAVRKEPNFFSAAEIRPYCQGIGDKEYQLPDLAGYQGLYRHAGDETARGEASNSTLYFPGAAEQVKRHVPQAKLIATLRHPADRAFSAYMHLRRDLREPVEDFREALDLEQKRIAAHWSFMWHYRRVGCYYPQLRRFYERFDASQIRVYLYDEFQAAPQDVLRDIFRFLNVDDQFQPTLKTGFNQSGLPRSPSLSAVAGRLFDRPNPIRFVARRRVREDTRLRFTQYVRSRNLQKQTMPIGLRRDLTESYREEILNLQTLIGKDLSQWLAD